MTAAFSSGSGNLHGKARKKVRIDRRFVIGGKSAVTRAVTAAAPSGLRYR